MLQSLTNGEGGGRAVWHQQSVSSDGKATGPVFFPIKCEEQALVSVSVGHPSNVYQVIWL